MSRCEVEVICRQTSPSATVSVSPAAGNLYTEGGGGFNPRIMQTK
jgi:hypothetical protein